MRRAVVIVVCLSIVGAGNGDASVLDKSSGTVVYPKLLESRSADTGHVLQVTEDVTLTLTRSNVFTEDFVVRSLTDDGATQEQWMKAADFEKHLYHDEKNMASVTVKTEGGLQVDGVLGLRRRIRPAPELERSLNDEIPHLLYEVEEAASQVHLGDRESDLRIMERQYEERETVTLPETVFPEVYVLCDSAHSMPFKGQESSAVQYIGIFINAVNMRYLSITNPNVQLRVIGIEITLEGRDTYIVHPPGMTDKMMVEESLRGFTNYVNENVIYTQYDIVYLLTGLDMSGVVNGRFTSDINGIAYTGQACTPFRTGISEDIARKFTGIRTFAHEVGHVLGCPHDGKPASPPMTKAPGSVHCSWYDGYIMSYLITGLNQYRFSHCCNTMMRITFRARSRRCLLEPNPRHHPIRHEKLPGELISRDKQCKWILNSIPDTKAVDTPELSKTCETRCLVPAGVRGRADYHPISLLDGSPCRGGLGICYNGVCRKRRPKF